MSKEQKRDDRKAETGRILQRATEEAGSGTQPSQDMLRVPSELKLPESIIGKKPLSPDEIYNLVMRMASQIESLVNREPKKEFYTVAQFSALVELAPYTLRQYFKSGRIRAIKLEGSRSGAFQRWAVSHSEYLRFQRERLLPPGSNDDEFGAGAFAKLAKPKPNPRSRSAVATTI